MQKTEYSTHFYHTVLFQCSKGTQIKFYTLPNNGNSQQKGIKTFTINHSADIDNNDFLKIYRNCTNELDSFLTIDTTLPAINLMRFRKNFSDSPL